MGLLLALFLLSTFIGFYNRVQSTPSPSASVIPKASVMVIPIEGMITSVGTQWDGSIVDVISEQLDQAKDANSESGGSSINSPGGMGCITRNL